MRNLEIVHRMRQQIKPVLRLAPWLLASLLVTVGLLRADLAANADLYQSPANTFQSPATPTATQIPAPPTDGPTVEPTAPQITETPTETPVLPEATSTPVATETAVQPTEEPTATATEVPATETATALPSPTATDMGDRYSEEDANLKFDWGMLFDSVALGATYLWLCCGGLLLVVIPVGFGVLWMTSKRLREAEQRKEDESFGDEEEGQSEQEVD